MPAVAMAIPEKTHVLPVRCNRPPSWLAISGGKSVPRTQEIPTDKAYVMENPR